MSLANKYRPKDWDDVIEQRYAIQILQNHLANQKFNSVYLFLAPAGVGKTTLARLFATKINGVPDSYVEIDAASYNSAESMRTLVENASTTSIGYEYKIFIIDEVHALSTQAFQVLLKIFEEAPKKTIFMLCTTEYKKVPETIKSRSLILKLARITNRGLLDRLKYICNKEGYDIKEEILVYISNVARGGLRSGISKLEQIVSAGVNDLESARKILDLGISEETLYKVITNLNNPEAVIRLVEDEIYGQCFGPEDFKQSLQQYVTDILKYYYTNEIRFTNLSSVDYLSGNIDTRQLRRLLKKLTFMSVVNKEVMDGLFILFNEEE